MLNLIKFEEENIALGKKLVNHIMTLLGYTDEKADNNVDLSNVWEFRSDFDRLDADLYKYLYRGITLRLSINENTNRMMKWIVKNDDWREIQNTLKAHPNIVKMLLQYFKNQVSISYETKKGIAAGTIVRV